MKPLLEAFGLSIPERLSETDLTLDAGQLVCLAGPNGSGKTSLLHALAGVGRPNGQVRIAGVDTNGLHPQRRQRLLSFLPSSHDIKWPLAARDVLALGLPTGDVRAAIDGIVEDLELSHFMGRRVDLLSTGERRRILIARALAAEPRLVLLDEPTANLDPLWQLKLMNYLRTLAHGGGQSTLVAIHDLDMAGRYADRLLLMDRGRIEADGEPDAILAGPHIPRIFGITRRDGRWQAAS